MKLNLVISFFALLGAFAQASTFDLPAVQNACNDPGSVQNQNAPTEISINCTGKKVEWTETIEEPVTLNQSASVTSSITTDKPDVGSDPQTLPVLVPNKTAGCTTYSKTDMTATSSYIVTCEQLILITDLSEWCFEKLTTEGQANPAIWVSTQSGEEYNPCDIPTNGTPSEPGTATFL